MRSIRHSRARRRRCCSRHATAGGGQRTVAKQVVGQLWCAIGRAGAPAPRHRWQRGRRDSRGRLRRQLLPLISWEAHHNAALRWDDEEVGALRHEGHAVGLRVAGLEGEGQAERRSRWAPRWWRRWPWRLVREVGPAGIAGRIARLLHINPPRPGYTHSALRRPATSAALGGGAARRNGVNCDLGRLRQ